MSPLASNRIHFRVQPARHQKVEIPGVTEEKMKTQNQAIEAVISPPATRQAPRNHPKIKIKNLAAVVTNQVVAVANQETVATLAAPAARKVAVTNLRTRRTRRKREIRPKVPRYQELLVL